MHPRMDVELSSRCENALFAGHRRGGRHRPLRRLPAARSGWTSPAAAASPARASWTWTPCSLGCSELPENRMCSPTTPWRARILRGGYLSDTELTGRLPLRIAGAVFHAACTVGCAATGRTSRLYSRRAPLPRLWRSRCEACRTACAAACRAASALRPLVCRRRVSPSAAALCRAVLAAAASLCTGLLPAARRPRSSPRDRERLQLRHAPTASQAGLCRSCWRLALLLPCGGLCLHSAPAGIALWRMASCPSADLLALADRRPERGRGHGNFAGALATGRCAGLCAARVVAALQAAVSWACSGSLPPLPRRVWEGPSKSAARAALRRRRTGVSCLGEACRRYGPTLPPSVPPGGQLSCRPTTGRNSRPTGRGSPHLADQYRPCPGLRAGGGGPRPLLRAGGRSDAHRAHPQHAAKSCPNGAATSITGTTRALCGLLCREYVSTVDSGNFAACLAVLAARNARNTAAAGSCRARLRPVRTPWISSRALTTRSAGLFRIGWDGSTGKLSDGALRPSGQRGAADGLPRRSPWRRASASLAEALSARLCPKDGYARGMASWTGTMFEYLMPELFLPLCRDSAAVGERALLSLRPAP